MLATAPDEFVFVGTAVTITFASATAAHQGRHVRLEPGRFSIQKVKLYLY